MNMVKRLILTCIIFSFMLNIAVAVTYVNHDNPTIRLFFQENVYITSATLDQEQISFTPDNFTNEFSHVSSLQAEGTHTLLVNAEGEDKKTFEEGPFQYDFYLDNTPPSISEINPPANQEYILQDNPLHISITFSEPIDTTTFSYSFKLKDSDVEIPGTVTLPETDLDKIFIDFIIDINGEYTLEISIMDPAGHELNQTITFTIIRFLDIEITSPPGGHSNYTEFDLIMNTNVEANCGYYLDFFASANYLTLEEEAFLPFTETGTLEHKELIDGIVDQDHVKLYVSCKAIGYNFEKRESFFLYVDTSPPVLTVESSDITSRPPFRTKIFISIDEDSICAYSQNDVGFDEMVLIDDDYDTYFEIRNESLNDNTQYTYFVACKNRAGLVSRASTSFIVDSELGINIVFNNPKNRYSPEDHQVINISTNRETRCKYSINDSTSIIKNSGTFGILSSEHVSNIEEFSLGKNIIYVKCEAQTTTRLINLMDTKELIIDETEPEIDTVNDTQPNEVDGKVYELEKVIVKVDADDPESGIAEYAYSINATNSNYTSGWIISHDDDPTIREEEDGDDLELVDGTNYYVGVKVKNNAGLWSKIMYSDGFGVDLSKIPGSCTNGYFDYGTETGTDCGKSCPSCKEGDSCLLNNDCDTGYCYDKVCTTPSCFDNIMNSDETGVDCGGSICSPCAQGTACRIDNDCITEYCNNGMCAVVDPCKNGLLDSGETDVDCGGVCSNKCSDFKRCEIDYDCLTGNCENGICRTQQADPNADEDGDGIPDSWERRYGLDANDPNTASQDPDNDGLTNLQEYQYGTDPTLDDTDNDSYSDGDEINANTDPLDPESMPKGGFPWWLIIIIMLIVLVIVGVVFFGKGKDKKTIKRIEPIKPIQKKPLGPRPLTPAEKLALKQKMDKQREERYKKDRLRRDSMFKTFGPGIKKTPLKPSQKPATAPPKPGLKPGTTTPKTVQKPAQTTTTVTKKTTTTKTVTPKPAPVKKPAAKPKPAPKKPTPKKTKKPTVTSKDPFVKLKSEIKDIKKDLKSKKGKKK